MCNIEDFIRQEMIKILENNEISQKDLSDQAHLHPSVVSRYLGGQKSKSETLFKMILALPPQERSELFWKINSAALVEHC